MSILSALMMVVIALFLLLYRSMKPQGVYLTQVRSEEEEVELEDAVGFMIGQDHSDRAILLEHDLLEKTRNSDNQAQDSEEAIL